MYEKLSKLHSILSKNVMHTLLYIFVIVVGYNKSYVGQFHKKQ